MARTDLGKPQPARNRDPKREHHPLNWHKPDTGRSAFVRLFRSLTPRGQAVLLDQAAWERLLWRATEILPGPRD
jgi:hypothetical protein